ncbi:MAG TPA: aldehyde oxygenase (deformylating) [Synechococcus sp. UBA8638]|uniref:aldehyde oxygenase (deformylating) n=1 Tax=Candidatus Synechococcus spongiarum TaxID=431041 RepID=UPI00047146EE|nr:aldehyde oxygenase (deformylating) [Candidatus Synechococcus spongiarum]HBP54053.1 aldehyde oxygenase (deformylating) [Synechococcus sp. UBA8638]
MSISATAPSPTTPAADLVASLPDFTSAAYKDAYSRINAIVIEGEHEAYGNYKSITTLLPEQAEELNRLARMEMKHMRGFQACGRNLKVTPDMDFAKAFFAPLRNNFQAALAEGKVATCLLIQAILIEAFSISAYHIYIPVADPFARRVTEGVVKDEYLHLNYGQAWLKARFNEVKDELMAANRANLPLIKTMLDAVETDAAQLRMAKENLIEDFLIGYQEALSDVGFTTREIIRMSAQALA